MASDSVVETKTFKTPPTVHTQTRWRQGLRVEYLYGTPRDSLEEDRGVENEGPTLDPQVRLDSRTESTTSPVHTDHPVQGSNHRNPTHLHLQRSRLGRKGGTTVRQDPTGRRAGKVFRD